MNVSYKWLNDYVDLTGVSPQELANKITKAGIEVEHVTSFAEGLKDVVVGYVETCIQHPSADKLKICQVNIGEAEPVQIVCGATNVGAGQKVAVAQVGAVLPGNFKIKKAKLRGEMSQGMICSLQELGVEGSLIPKEVAQGIYILEEDAEVGTNALPYINLDDVVLELDILPNSAHCLNMIGVAYEVAAILDREIHLPTPNVEETAVDVTSKISVQIDDRDKVSFYGMRVIEGVQVEASPQWLQNKLMTAGIRPISNIVDIANFVMLEYGQPLHAFDYDAFASDKAEVRHAQNGEQMTTLDGIERTLTADDLVITNGKVPVGIAGVMGGADSEVTDDTTTILLEAAIFDGISIRRTASRLGLHTDASSRYEKGVDRNRVAEAADRAAELITQIAGGQVLKGFTHVGELTISDQLITMPWDKINAVLGTTLSLNEILSVFRRLRFEARIEGEQLKVAVPARRPDVMLPEDLIEEVGRIYGYDHVPATLPEGRSTAGVLTDYQLQRRRVQRHMEGAGLYQAVTYALTTEEKVKSVATIDEASYQPIPLAMPMSQERAVLRLSLIPTLCEITKYHLNRQINDVTFFELGKGFYSKEKKLVQLPEEREQLAAILTGNWQSAGWQTKAEPIDFFVAKGILEGLFHMLHLTERISYQPTQREGLHPGRTANVWLDQKVIGFVGQLHPDLQSKLGLKETYVFELDIEQVLHAERESLRYMALPRYPAISRDISLVVDEALPSGDLIKVIKDIGEPLLREVKLFDIYQDDSLGAGKKSMAYALKYLDPDKTLTDKEADKVHAKVLQALETTFDAVLRE